MHQTKLTRSSAPRIDALRFGFVRDRYRASRSTRVGLPAEVMRIPDPSRPLPLLGSCHAKANANVNVRADVTVHIRLALDASEPRHARTPVCILHPLSIPSHFTNRNTPSTVQITSTSTNNRQKAHSPPCTPLPLPIQSINHLKHHDHNTHQRHLRRRTIELIAPRIVRRTRSFVFVLCEAGGVEREGEREGVGEGFG